MEAEQVVMEVKRPDGAWGQVGRLGRLDPPGSLHSDAPDGRQVYMFGWYPGDRGPGVWRSVEGMDLETPAIRVISSSGFDRLADLSKEPFELEIARAEVWMTVRWRLETDV